MRRIFSLAVLVLVLLPGYGFSAEAKGSSKCQALSKEEVATVLKDMIPNLTILEVRDAPVQNMCEVTFDSGGKKSLLYLEMSKKYIFGGSIIEIASKKNLTQARFEEISKVDVSQIPLDDALVMGDKNAKHRIIVFDDPV